MNPLKTLYWRTLELPGQSLRGLKRLVEPSGMGDWIFRVPVVQWAFDPALRRQLPWPHRLFIAYSSLFRRSQGQVILGGEHLFSLAVHLHRLFRMPPQIRMHLGKYTVYLNPYDPRMLQVPNELTSPDLDALKLSHFLSPGDTFIDVGANHGSFSLVASRLVGTGGMVVAVEPQPLLSKLVGLSLQETAECPFEVYQFACSDHEGQANFYVPFGSSGSAGLIPGFSAKGQHQTFNVALKRFDDSVDWKSFTGHCFVKLDVEGSEMAFLRGAEQMLRERKPKIMMEVNPNSMAQAGVELEELIAFFTERGYSHFIELNQPSEQLPLAEMRNVYRNVVICAED